MSINVMTDKKNSLGQYSTIHCQNLIKKYSGTGILKHKNNKGYPCEFEVGQLVDGRIVLTCDCPYSYMHDFQEEISLDTAQGFKFFEGFTNKSESITGKINLCTKLADGI
ncbi:hypothetical protein DU67_07445 [Methanosarcina mazei]|uniref:Uncharacterized protein n=2 Tax=Methanosarcina mazei TaxID=2209 RepID=A0A0F8GGT4_METMZ|nr:hypothetical protein DU67_07445 [Methanosarcina mazei]